MRAFVSSRGSTTADDRRSIVSGNSSNASTLVPESITSIRTNSSQLRKFTAAVGKPGVAREAREAVRNAISTQNPTRTSPISEPLDYEKFVSERTIQLENDPQREILLFPRDDVQETLVEPDQSTVISPISPEDASNAKWLLTKEAVKLYTSPYKTITFNYNKFVGDYNKMILGSSIENEVSLSSLVFESDMALEEERAAMEGFYLTDVVKEGYVMIVKNESSLLDNLKSIKKRYCVLRREPGGDIVIETRKTANESPKQAAMKVNSAQLKSMKKGKSVLQIEPCPDGNEKNEQKPLIIASDDSDELSSWLLHLNRAIALANKGDTMSSCSEQLDKSGKSLNDSNIDTESIGSEDSAGSKEVNIWRGRNSAARALQPPIVDRRNLFSVYYRLGPLMEPKGEQSCLLSRGRGTSTANPTLKTSRRRRSTLTNIGNAIRFMIEFKKLELKLPTGNNVLQQIEPFFVSMFLFDANSSRRISEEFHIDFSGEDSVTASDTTEINGVSKSLLCSKLANQMLCTVAKPNKDIWVVCKVDRMLSADTVGELYMKSSVDPKAVNKLQKVIHSSTLRLSGYRQRFAWGARPVFPELRGENSSKDFNSIQLYRCENNKFVETDVYKHLNDFIKFEKAGKLAIPNGTLTLKIDLSSNLSEIPFRLNPSWFPLRPWTSPKDSPVPPMFELQSFGDIAADPHCELVNLLYIYPLSLKYDAQKIFSKARNIACTVRFIGGDTPKESACLMDRLSNRGPYVSSMTCGVQHHQQNPSFGDELKLRLPLHFTQHDHLLFSFFHVSVAGQTSAKSPESTEIPVGYSWLPLVWRKDRLVLENDEQEFALPVAVDLPPNYLRSKPLGLGKGDEIADVRWVDQKPLFRFRLRMVSSAFTTEVKLHSFFQACQRLDSKKVSGDAADLSQSRVSKSSSPSGGSDPARSCSPLARSSSVEDNDPCVFDLVKRTQGLCDVPIEKLLPFLHIILARLLSLLSKAPTDQLAISTLSALVSICDRTSSDRINLLRNFVRLHFSTTDEKENEEPTHIAICKYLPDLLRQVQGNLDELAAIFRQLWFFFDVCIKSIAQVVVHKSLYKTTRRDRFSSDLMEQMTSLFEVVIPHIIVKHKEIPEECRSANTAVAYFMRCSLSFLDRGIVFKWFHFAVQRLDDHESKILREYKNDFLTILTQHEHWLPLCLPVLLDGKNQIQRMHYQGIQSENTSVTNTANGTGFLSRFFHQVFQSPSLAEASESDRYSCCADEWWLSKNYSSRHFPVGLLFQELHACLREPREHRKKPIIILRNLLAKHTYDKRYSDMNIQRRIATLYIPLLRFAIDNIHELQAAIAETPEPSTTGLRATNKWRSLDRKTLQMTEPFRTATGAFNCPTTPLAEKLDQEEVQDILICVLWVIYRLPKRILGAVWSDNEAARAQQIIALLRIALTVFQYRGKEEALESTCRDIRCTSKTIHLLPPSSSRLPSVDLNGSSVSDQIRIEEENSAPLPFGVLQLLNLCQESALIVLDAVQSLSQQLASRKNKSFPHEEELFCNLLSMHLALLEDHWPESVRLHAIAAIALFVNQFRSRLFEGSSLDALSSLIERVLLQMASRLSTIQSAAAALLQLILRNGYETAQVQIANQAMALSVLPHSQATEVRPLTAAERLGRPGAQTGVALARLLGAKTSLSSSGRFEKGLTALESLVSVDSRKITVFEKAVFDLIKQLRGVMTATVALKDASNDQIRLADLHIQLADSYRGSAALRSAWFDTLAEAHTADRWFSEAAVCHAHSVAIMAKELMDSGEIDFDWNLFNWISVEVAETEKSREKERNVQSAGFTENLASKIEKTAQALTLAERYEAIGPLYRVLVPIFEKRNNFNALVSVYAELQQIYSRAAEVKTSGKRHLGSYFRVRFYGQRQFESDHDTEWIYREAGLTSLAEVSLRFNEYCRLVLGLEKVQVEPENELDMSKVDPDIAYVQVTHVEPLITEGLKTKDFWSHTNINKFVYECPIVEGDKKEKQPHITKQALKRVSLEVAGFFPASRRRLRVISKGVERFTPLNFACQKLLVKADQIRSTLDGPAEGRALDVKGLQLLLQGAVMPTVNAGPLAYAEAFTQLEEKQRYGDTAINELKEAFRTLMSSCESALNANQNVVGADQQTYHDVLVSSFDAMHERLQIFFGESLRKSAGEEKKSNMPKTAIHILDSIGGVHA
ncbi:unnamed protein product [Auanema sp. JU1783]|nr:unnamed protein product [Auanema sp. JU1783]